MKRRRLPPAGERCTAPVDAGHQCPNRYRFGERPLLCTQHHIVLRRSIVVFGAAPATWTSLRPRGWTPAPSFGVVVLGPDDTLRFLVSPDGEPVAVAAGGGLIGVDSSEVYAKALVAERAKMAWLRRLALDRPDVERALRLAATTEVGEWVAP